MVDNVRIGEIYFNAISKNENKIKNKTETINVKIFCPQERISLTHSEYVFFFFFKKHQL